jgi:hypothetical protein
VDNKAPQVRIGVSPKEGGMWRAPHACCMDPLPFTGLYRISCSICCDGMVPPVAWRFSLRCIAAFFCIEILISHYEKTLDFLYFYRPENRFTLRKINAII